MSGQIELQIVADSPPSEAAAPEPPARSQAKLPLWYYVCNTSPPNEEPNFFTNEFRWKPLIDAQNGERTTWVPIHPFCSEYWKKFAGLSFRMSLPLRGPSHIAHSLISFISSFVGMLLVALIFQELASDSLLMASLGATSVLVYAAPASPMAQPRNVIVGNLIGAAIGVSMNYAFKDTDVLWIGAAFAVSLSIFFMDVTNTMHPPAGATSLLPIIGSQAIRDAGYLYVVYPVLVSQCILVLVALVINNLVRFRSYPHFWI